MCGTNRMIRMLQEAAEVVTEAAETLIREGSMQAGEVLVLGCSTSEVLGERMGQASNPDVAETLVCYIYEACKKHGIFLAVQCSEQLNRTLVVEGEAAQIYGWEKVSLFPDLNAGGSAAVTATGLFHNPVVVKEIKAHAGMDIGDTLIRMHLKAPAVPVQISRDKVGYANMVLVKTQ